VPFKHFPLSTSKDHYSSFLEDGATAWDGLEERIRHTHAFTACTSPRIIVQFVQSFDTGDQGVRWGSETSLLTLLIPIAQRYLVTVTMTETLAALSTKLKVEYVQPP
jgi:hypothetical protein